MPLVKAQGFNGWKGGGIESSATEETGMAGIDSSVRLHIRDQVTGELFLVDTGVEISLLPTYAKNKTPTNFKLYEANNTRIDTYGESFRTLHLEICPIT